MKKIIVLSIAFVLCCSLISFALTDIDGHWGKPYIDKLTAEGAIAGYPDGSFRPENTISTAEFTKILVALLGYDIQNDNTAHWAENYMAKARQLELIYVREREFNAYDMPITRGMMARLISRALSDSYDDAKDYLPQIKDYQQMEPKNQLPVLAVYRAGIVTGYPDGSFQDGGVATRAEACTMLARFIDPTLRKIPELQHLEIDYKNGEVTLPSGVCIAERGPNDSPTKYDFYVGINVWKPLEPQYRDCEAFLTRWLDQPTIDQAMAIVKTKKERWWPEIYQEISYQGKRFSVGAQLNGDFISVEGFLSR